MTSRKRLKCTPSQLHVNQSVCPPTKIWLDLLPTEINHRIAVHLCRGKQVSSGLTFAQLGPIQTLSITHALSNTLHICLGSFRAERANYSTRKREMIYSRNESIARTIREWMCVLGENADALVQHGNLINVKVPRFISSIICMPKLKKANISDCPHQVAAISTAKSIRELTICMNGLLPPQEVLRAISCLNVVTIGIHCEHWSWSRFRCPFASDTVARFGLESFMPAAETAIFRCRCRSNENNERRFWALIQRMQNVKDLTILWSRNYSWIPSKAFEYLASRSKVRLVHCRKPLDFARRIGPAVMEMVQDRNSSHSFSARDLVDMRQLQRLESLTMNIDSSMSHLVPDAVRRLPMLQSLHLYSMVYGSPFTEPECEIARPGTFLRTVQAGPRISKFGIGTMEVSQSELLTILKVVNSRLLEFETSSALQEEPEHERAAVLLAGILDHNKNLRKLKVFGRYGMDYDTLSEEEVCGWKNVSHLARIFARRMPHTDMGSLSFCS